MLRKKGKSITIFLSLVIIISVVFIIYNFISAQIEETPAFILNIPGSLKTYFQAKANCPAFATDVADNNALTIKDTCTGLVWARYELPTMKSAGDPNPGYTWAEAKTECENLVKLSDGSSMFRLPKVEELLSIINYHCEESNCVALAPLVRPAFSQGIYWTISDFHEPDYWTNVNAEPAGVPARDYKRSVNLLTGEVDSPVFGQDVRLNALCVVDRQPEILERKFISANTISVLNGTQVTGGTLKTVYHRQCDPSNDTCNQNINGTSCQSIPISMSDCGDFIVENPEQCDGTANTAATPADSSSTKQYYCTADCHLTGGYCGDNTTQFLKEECDGNSGVATSPGESSKNRQYACTNCQFTGGWCGDNTVQTAKGEQCDGSANVATSAATSSVNKQYACTNDCQFPVPGVYCGDGVLQPEKGEQCDSTVSPSPSNSSVSNQYTCTNCLPTGGWCGDGTAQTAKGEQCDDGNKVNIDACNNDCQWTIFTTPITFDNSNGMADSVSGDGVVYAANDLTTEAIDAAGGTYLKVASVMPTPYIWIANSNYNTVTKMRTYDGYKRNCTRSGGETNCSWDKSSFETRGQTFPPVAVGLNPSRTAVNVETGDVWIANRDSGTVTKLDINGNFLKTCCTTYPCNPGGYSTGPRGLAIEEDGDVWVANYGVVNVYAPGTVNKIPGDDTTCPTSFTLGTNSVYVGGYPYGLAIDSNGNIWVSNNNPYQSSSSIQKINASTFAVESHYAPYIYGITIDMQDNAWGGCWNGLDTCKGVYEVAHDALAASAAILHAQSHDTTGITIDLAGNIWASNYPVNTVVKIDQSNGNVIDYFDQLPALSDPPAATGHINPHGIVGDSQGNIWSVQRYGDNARVFDSSGNVLADYPVNSVHGTDSENYTYSDMTGLNRALHLRSGIWLAKFDSNNNDQHWGSLTWTQSVPGAKQSVEVLVRSSNNSDFSGATWQLATVWNGSARTGRYLQIKITVHSNASGITPVVSGLMIQ